jgi:hypothetical protein
MTDTQMTIAQSESYSPPPKTGRKPWPFVVVTTAVNGAGKVQKGHRNAGTAIEQLEWLAATQPLQETELIIRNVDGDELTLRVV